MNAHPNMVASAPPSAPLDEDILAEALARPPLPRPPLPPSAGKQGKRASLEGLRTVSEPADALAKFAADMREKHFSKRKPATDGRGAPATVTTSASSFERTAVYRAAPAYDTRRLPTTGRRRTPLANAPPARAGATTASLAAARIGCVESRRAGNAMFQQDCVTFDVDHPKQGKVHVRLVYAHMNDARVERAGLHAHLVLRLRNPLDPHFALDEFDPSATDKRGEVRLTFESPTQVDAAVASVPRLRAVLRQ